MLDKNVVLGDFSGIKPNKIVKHIHNGSVGLCLETFLTYSSLGEGSQEVYHPTVVVLIKGKREYHTAYDLVLVDD